MEATEEQRDHCEQWERRSAGQEEGIPPNVPVPESTRCQIRAPGDSLEVERALG